MDVDKLRPYVNFVIWALENRTSYFSKHSSPAYPQKPEYAWIKL